MADSREALRIAAKQIRDEHRIGANTATRVGSLLLALVDAGVDLEELKKEFLSKTGTDRTEYLLEMLGGAFVRGGIDTDSITVGDFASGVEGSGACIGADGSAELLQLLIRSGINIGDFIPGLLGCGIRLKDGKIEADSMELRKELIVPTLIYNRVRVVGNELWVTEGGDIESIEPDANSADNLYWLKLKDTDASSPCPFWEDDIIRGIVKTKGNNGQFGGFYTVELRVVAISADQTFSVIPRYADKAPVAGLTIARIGNFTNRERMRSIYLSSDGGYIRFLDEVDGWDILPRMIKSQLGKMDGVVVPGLEDIGGYNAYLNNVLARGAFVQISQDGVTERPVPCFKGEWSAGKYYYYDEVTRNGNRYLCIAKTTEQQPAYDSTDWLMTEGNAKFSVSINSSKGYEFFAGKLDTTLSATVYSGNEDITGGIATSAVKWTRLSGDADSDIAWNTAHIGNGLSIALTYDDIPPTSPDVVEFACEVTIYYNDNVYKPSDSIFV